MPMLLRLLFSYGLRFREDVSIKVGDTDFNCDAILLRVTKKCKQRLVSYNQELADMVYKYCLAMDILSDCNAYLFPGANKSTPLAGNSVKNYFNGILVKAGISREEYGSNERGSCIHCLRHDFTVCSFDKNERTGMKALESIPF